MSPADMVRIRHAVEDHAGRWYGQVGPFVFGLSDCARYLTEGVLRELCDERGWDWRELWELVEDYLSTHRQVLEVRYTDEQIRQREDERKAAAKRVERQAYAAFQAGDFDRALELLDEAELAFPDGCPRADGWHLVPWESLRVRVRRAQVSCA